MSSDSEFNSSSSDKYFYTIHLEMILIDIVIRDLVIEIVKIKNMIGIIKVFLYSNI